MDIYFDNVSFEEALLTIFKFVDNNVKGYICTPNPEMLLEAENNQNFKKVLNDSALNIADGIGILWAASQKQSPLKAILSLPLLPFLPNLFKKNLKERVTGSDLLLKVCEKASILSTKIFLLGASPGIAEKTADKLKNMYPGLNIVGNHAGSPDQKEESEIIDKINNSKADILFVAYGAPNQEMWIARNLEYFETVKVAIGVGGAFDFVAGKRKRAPKWMQKLGLEWLFRLIQEPTRIMRIYNATVKFPIHFIRQMKK